MNKVLEIIRPPFKYDKDNNVITDVVGNFVLNVSNWPRNHFYHTGERLEDEFGKLVCDGLNSIAQQKKVSILELFQQWISCGERTEIQKNCVMLFMDWLEHKNHL